MIPADVLSSFNEAQDPGLPRGPIAQVVAAFSEIWDGPDLQKDRGVLYSHTAREPTVVEQAAYDYYARQRRPPPWYIGMTSKFKKDIDNIDKKLQGRILEAVTELTDKPMELRGDTVKPLSGELEGCWRYRIGDYRLIYRPDQGAGNITLIAFASRSAAYAD